MLTLEWLADLANRNRSSLNAQVAEFLIQGQRFSFNSQPGLMGVINLSPDSWYRESVVMSVEGAIERALLLKAQGADVVDLGAESTLAHAARVNGSEQNARLIPVLQALAGNGPILSVETYQPEVAQACLEAGAGVLNLTGSEDRDKIYPMVAAHDAALILCYVQGKTVRTVGDFDFSHDPVGVMYEYFGAEIEKATQAGVSKIFVDPGLGFYYRNLNDSEARVRHQMSVFLNTFRLRALGFPTCNALPHAFEYFQQEVRSAEPFFAVLAALGKTDLFRTHEIPRTQAVLKTLGVF